MIPQFLLQIRCYSQKLTNFSRPFNNYYIIGLLMDSTRLCQTLAREPSPATNPVGKYPVKEGANLPSSITEDILGFSISREYTPRQLRRINRLKALRGNSHARMVYAERVPMELQTSVQAKKRCGNAKMLLDLEQMELEE
jgi:hypothetical protein